MSRGEGDIARCLPLDTLGVVDEAGGDLGDFRRKEGGSIPDDGEMLRGWPMDGVEREELVICVFEPETPRGPSNVLSELGAGGAMCWPLKYGAW